ncbi:MAG: hypothetical protein HXX16_00195 [Bacteroidales bacterium]|nr:hypothetical protein [Bacteroidales bacterium]
MIRIIQIAFLFLISIGLFAQPYTNKRITKIIAISDTIKLDTLSIIPNSCFMVNENGRIIDSTYYKLIYSEAMLIPSAKLKELSGGFSIVYRVFPVSFSKEYFNKNKSELFSPDSLLGKQAIKYVVNSSYQKPLGDNIESSGSISRGISFGNNQDPVVNSGLNLQISGKLDNNVSIEGAISDKTIPFQPQGNTQRLEEFDRIYLRAYTSKFEIQAGDIEIKSRNNGFLNFKRKVQGLSLTTNQNYISADDTTSIKASIAVAKGIFFRNSFNGIEGNQGPYKLKGSEGETYIIVIAGSERVYVDGKALTRGEANQYTIDYNTAEVTFTPMMRITGNSRISVEFEYTDRSYARFVIASEVEQKIKKTTVRVSTFSEKDSKNQPIEQDISNEQIDLLQNIGDNISQAYIPQIDSIGFNPDKILYEKRDTIVNSITYIIYKHSTNPLSSHFQLNFSYMGERKGNYVPLYSSANGKVYTWVAPLNGKSMGTYEPVKVLVTPKQKQMATIFIERKISSDEFINSEVAVSRNDINTFSSKDKGNDIGEALRVGFKKNLFKRDTIRSIWISGNGAITSYNFSNIDRSRDVEFERDWNISQPTTGGDEKELSIGVGLKSKKWFLSNTSQGLALKDDYSGLRNTIKGLYRTSRSRNEFEVSNLSSKDSMKTSDFNRLRIISNINIKKIIVGLNVEGEDNSQKNKNTNKLLQTSYRWFQSEFNIGLPDSLPRVIGLSYKYRKDWKTPENQLKTYSYSQDIGLKARLSKRQNSRLNFYAGYRLFNPIDTTIAKSLKKENSLLSRIDYSFTVAKDLMSTNIGYELGNGLEPKYQYYYVEVLAGQGVFTWIDYNGNGIKELDEFEIAAFKDEAKYIRINLPSNQYVSVNNNALSIQSDIRPENMIRDTSWLGLFTKKLSNQFAFSTRQKNDYSGLSSTMNPFRNNVYDSNLVSINKNYRNSIAYNRFSRAFGVEWVNSRAVAKQILANGYEVSKLKNNQFIAWIGFSSEFSVRLNYNSENRIQLSEFFNQRKFNLKKDIPAIKFRYVGMLGLNIEVGYEYEYARNKTGLEVKRGYTILSEMSYSIRNKSWINVSSNISKINYAGDLGTPIEYELLKGFKPGNNATWELKLRRKISNYFEMDISYNGRYISTGETVHTGSMQIRAIF